MLLLFPLTAAAIPCVDRRTPPGPETFSRGPSGEIHVENIERLLVFLFIALGITLSEISEHILTHH